MTVLTDKEFIRRRFSDAASHYRDFADIQDVIARELVVRANVARDMSVLDVGAGDGRMAQVLIDAGAHVIAVDGAWGMASLGLRRSPHAAWLQADAALLPFASRSFDTVISSSVYQWVDDLPGAFAQVRRVLKPGGRFMVAMFGHNTLDELFVSMDRAARSSGKSLPALRRLPSVARVREALYQAGFQEPVVEVERRTTRFQDIKAILVWLKGIGANALTRKFFWGRVFLAATQKEYRVSFPQGDKLRATFEIIWIEAKV
jgi:malonyl-CoA O-methyltransferase